MEKVSDYIRSLNFGYKKALNSEKIVYHNALARLKSANEI